MKVWGLFHGGSSYSLGDVEDVEEFSSIREAVDTLEYRYRGWDYSFPVVDENASMFLYFVKPGVLDNPDRVYGIGPRRGITRMQ